MIELKYGKYSKWSEVANSIRVDGWNSDNASAIVAKLYLMRLLESFNIVTVKGG